MDKICILSISFTPYFNFVSNFSIALIWSMSLSFRWKLIADVANSQNKKLVSVDVAINYFFYFYYLPRQQFLFKR